MSHVSRSPDLEIMYLTLIHLFAKLLDIDKFLSLDFHHITQTVELDPLMQVLSPVSFFYLPVWIYILSPDFLTALLAVTIIFKSFSDTLFVEIFFYSFSSQQWILLLA